KALHVPDLLLPFEFAGRGIKRYERHLAADFRDGIKLAIHGQRRAEKERLVQRILFTQGRRLPDQAAFLLQAYGHELVVGRLGVRTPLAIIAGDGECRVAVLSSIAEPFDVEDQFAIARELAE